MCVCVYVYVCSTCVGAQILQESMCMCVCVLHGKVGGCIRRWLLASEVEFMLWTVGREGNETKRHRSA